MYRLTHKYYGSEVYELPARIFMDMIAKAKAREAKEELKIAWNLYAIKGYVTGEEVKSFDGFIEQITDASKPIDIDAINKKFNGVIEADRRKNNG